MTTQSEQWEWERPFGWFGTFQSRCGKHHFSYEQVSSSEVLLRNLELTPDEFAEFEANARGLKASMSPKFWWLKVWSDDEWHATLQRAVDALVPIIERRLKRLKREVAKL